MPIRLLLALLLLCLPSLLYGLADQDSWPFSCFPMYSYPFKLKQFQQHSVYVVTREGKAYELRQREVLWPLNVQRVQVRSKLLLGMPDGQERVRSMLRYFLARVRARHLTQGKSQGYPASIQLRRCYGVYRVDRAVLDQHILGHQVVCEVSDP